MEEEKQGQIQELHKKKSNESGSDKKRFHI